MALRNLFKSKAARPKPDPRIRWFGKLPTYPDYYSSPADEAWAVEFNDWVLKGFEMYRGRVGARHTPRLPSSGAAIRLPKSGMTVFACFLDYGGDMRGRPFPLCFYAAVPSDQWPGPTSDRVSGASRAIRDLWALRREVPRFINSPGRFESIFGNREVDLAGIDAETSDRSWETAGRSLLLSEWFEGVRASVRTTDWAEWLSFVTSRGERLTAGARRTIEPTLAFPLAMRHPLDAQLAGWIRWLETRLDVTDRLMSLLVSGEPEHDTGQLTVIMRELMVDDFLLLTPLMNTLPYVEDMSAPNHETVALPDASGICNTGGRVSTQWQSWADFVCAPTRGG